MEKIKPCPFCGNTSDTQTADGKIAMLPVVLEEAHFPEAFGAFHPKTERYFHVRCKQCGACGGFGVTGFNGLLNITTTEDRAKEIAIAKWNTRG